MFQFLNWTIFSVGVYDQLQPKNLTENSLFNQQSKKDGCENVNFSFSDMSFCLGLTKTLGKLNGTREREPNQVQA